MLQLYPLVCTTVALYCRYMIMHGGLYFILRKKYSLRSANYLKLVSV